MTDIYLAKWKVTVFFRMEFVIYWKEQEKKRLSLFHDRVIVINMGGCQGNKKRFGPNKNSRQVFPQIFQVRPNHNECYQSKNYMKTKIESFLFLLWKKRLQPFFCFHRFMVKAFSQSNISVICLFIKEIRPYESWYSSLRHLINDLHKIAQYSCEEKKKLGYYMGKRNSSHTISYMY